ncbi:MAG: hypothetical protein NXH85_12985 [Pseudomonadaceae bacterium]|nr:hypothetical protein [Pseudomonadaceae bacterium]
MGITRLTRPGLSPIRRRFLSLPARGQSNRSPQRVELEPQALPEPGPVDGAGELLSWDWVINRIKDQREFTITTMHAVYPHSTPITAAWVEGNLILRVIDNIGRRIDRGPGVEVTLCSEDATIEVSGQARRVRTGEADATLWQRAYADKYGFNAGPINGLFVLVPQAVSASRPRLIGADGACQREEYTTDWLFA